MSYSALKQRINDLIDSADQANDIEVKKKLLDGQLTSASLEQRYIHKNGQLVWVESHLSLITDGKGKPLRYPHKILAASALI